VNAHEDWQGDSWKRRVGNLVVGLGMVMMCLGEHMRCRRRSPGWRPAALLSDICMWPFLAVISLGIAGLPVLHAQAKLLFGSPLAYVSTPKKAARRAAHQAVPK
jgi:hypothetical protein